MDRIYLDGRHYDLMFPHGDDIGFFLSQARMLGGPVLELACGTGRILECLSKAGFAATGIDLSPGMLAEAHRKSQAGATSSRYIQADIRRFSLEERFALIFIAGNSICHLLDIDSFDACMSCVRGHLAKGGRFVIDVYVPDLRRLLVEPHVRQRLSEYDDPDGAGRVVVTQTTRYDSVTQISSVKTFHRFPDGRAETEGSFELKMYFPQELQALLRHNGLSLLEAYGGYEKTPLTNASARQIYILGAA
jgi:SAM-dependent methyltransferase